MDQHPTEQQLAQYARRTLAPDEFLAVRRHVNECDRCDALCYEPGRERADIESLLASLTPAADEAPYHLTAEDAAAYTANRLDEIDREPITSHLEVCVECSTTVERLRSSSPAVATVMGPAATTVPRPGDARRASDRESARFGPRPGQLAWLQAPSLRLAAAALLVVGLLGGALWLWLRERDSQPAPLTRRASPTNGDAPAQPSHAPAQPAPSSAPTSPPALSGNVESPVQSATTGQRQDAPPQDHETPHSDSVGAQGAQAVLALDDGGQRITLDERGNLGGYERLPERERQLIGSALATHRLARPSFAADLNPPRSTMLGAGGDAGRPFRLLGPVGVVVESDRPTFSWQPLAGADTYDVAVTDDRLNEVASSGPVRATAWRALRPLGRGTTYSWQVTARLADGRTITSPVLPAPPAKFRVLGRAQLEELRRARRAYPGSHLALGVLYARAGLSDEAVSEFEALARRNPRSEVARKLLRSARLNARRR